MKGQSILFDQPGLEDQTKVPKKYLVYSYSFHLGFSDCPEICFTVSDCIRSVLKITNLLQLHGSHELQILVLLASCN